MPDILVQNRAVLGVSPELWTYPHRSESYGHFFGGKVHLILALFAHACRVASNSERTDANIRERSATKMNNRQPELLDLCDAPPAGYVSAKCHFMDNEFRRLVFVNSELAYCYDKNDHQAQRQVWTMVYVSDLATYRQIATATGISRRALQYWVQRYREEGSAGLPDRPRPGAPKKVTPAVRKEILRLRQQRLKLTEIAQCCGISKSAVHLVVDEHRRAAEAKQVALDLCEPTPAEAGRELGPQPESPPQAEASSSQPQHSQSTSEVSAEHPPEPPMPGAVPVIDEHELILPENKTDERREAAMAVDRSLDRFSARLGLIDDAQPLFAPSEHLEFAGGFLAIAAAAEDPFLPLAAKTYGSFGAAFYGVRTMLLTLLLLTLLRIKRPEWLRRHNPEKLGRILGLDRAPEVKTLRRRLHHFERCGQATELMHQLAEARVGRYDGPVDIVQIDGHQVVYHGAKKVGEVFSTRCKKVLKAQTDNWVHLPGGFPLLAVTSEFNQALSKVLPDVLEKARATLGVQRLCCCFDRGGYNVLQFEQLIAEGFDLITYRKGDFEPIAESSFPPGPLTINNRTYPRAPYQRDIELKIYEPVERGPNCKPARRDTRRTLKLREIRILREDGGQTAILTSCTRSERSAESVAGVLFDRIGSQENNFKYLREQFLLDALAAYDSEAIEGRLDHPNPTYTQLEKDAAKLRQARNKLLGKYAQAFTGADAAAAVACLLELRKDQGARGGKLSLKQRQSLPKDADKLADIQRRLEHIAAELAQTPARESLSAAGYRRLNRELHQFMNVVKISAYHIESAMVELLSPHYRRSEDESRSIIAAALRSSGTLKLRPGQLVIQIEPQGEPRRTRAINHLAAELTARRIRFPRSSRTIVFEPTPAPPPPQASDEKGAT